MPWDFSPRAARGVARAIYLSLFVPVDQVNDGRVQRRSGNTSEPHLHVHAVREGTMAAPDGTPVPILFNGTFPVRNTILPTSTDPRQWVVHRHTGRSRRPPLSQLRASLLESWPDSLFHREDLVVSPRCRYWSECSMPAERIWASVNGSGALNVGTALTTEAVVSLISPDGAQPPASASRRSGSLEHDLNRRRAATCRSADVRRLPLA